MAQKDKIEKLLEDYNDVFADIVNTLGFNGQRLVSQNSLSPGPTASIYQDAEGGIREQFRDVVKYCSDADAVLALFGLENQTAEDWDMVFRMMRYDGSAYKQQAGQRKKYPVISFVLYFGVKPWKAPRTVHQALAVQTPHWQKALKLVPNYHMNLIEIAFLPKEIREQFTSDFRIVAEYFYARRTHKEKDFFEGPEGKRKIRHVRELLEFFRTFSGDARYEAIMNYYEFLSQKGETDMTCSLLDYIEQKGMNQGIQALVETCRELGQSYDSTRNRLIDKFSLTESQAQFEMDKYWK